MTTRKRLTDMVREEVQKTSESSIPKQSEPTLSADLNPLPKIGKENQPLVKQVELIAETTENSEKTENTKNNPTEKPTEKSMSNPTNVNNERELTLKQELSQAEAKIVSLTAELNSTQSYLAQASQVKIDLDNALAENLTLKAEIAELKGQNSQLTKTQAKAPLAKADQERLRISQLLHRPVGSNAEQNRINNQNIGWFD
jgi:hypothetical protein